MASALIHIRHRTLDDAGRLNATPDDYRLVYECAGPFIAQSLSDTGISQGNRILRLRAEVSRSSEEWIFLQEVKDDQFGYAAFFGFARSATGSRQAALVV
jgi:hypothetical protein